MRAINDNYKAIKRAYNAGQAGIVLEGSSRSGKTYSIIDYIIELCSVYDRRLVFNIIKETYNSFKTTLYDDFSARLDTYGLDNPFDRSREVATFNIFNHKINLIGADTTTKKKASKFHGASCDFLWLNEALQIDKMIFDNAEMRCRKFFIMDYNPSVSMHYIYDSVIPRDDVDFCKTTFDGNPFLSRAERNKILSYDPNNPENIRQGTADDYMWNVYGLGLRMSRTGLVYRGVTWVNAFPKEYENIGYALDLGFTNSPTALTKVTTNGNDLYGELLIYEPTETPEHLGSLLSALGITKEPIWCDSAHPIFISKLCDLGFKVFAISKTPIMDGIAMVKEYKLHIVKNKDAQKEQENYSMREVNGIPLDEPIKKHDHFWDSLRYNVLANFRK